jgi:hypothetical protein
MPGNRASCRARSVGRPVSAATAFRPPGGDRQATGRFSVLERRLLVAAAINSRLAGAVRL